jgi:hypothetical protein
MNWISAIIQLLGYIAWPVTVLAIIILFRREIRQRLKSVMEVKYPGGSITMREVERLEEKVEEVAVLSSRQVAPSRSIGAIPAPHSDSRLAIAQMRLDSEREMFLISRHALHYGEVVGWHVDRYIQELEKAKILDPPLVDNIQGFITLANKIVHDISIPNDVVERAAAVGSSLVATLRHKRLVIEAEQDFEGHGLWHMHHHVQEEDKKHYFWSAVAASLPELDYDYDVYREAAERYNEKLHATGEKRRAIYVLPLEEFVSVLEFRESELLRIIGLWRAGHGWDKGNRAIEWQWPSEWGHLGWTGPILRERVHLWGAEEDLMRTRVALAHYRSLLLSLRRSQASGHENRNKRQRSVY